MRLKKERVQKEGKETGGKNETEYDKKQRQKGRRKLIEEC